MLPHQNLRRNRNDDELKKSQFKINRQQEDKRTEKPVPNGAETTFKQKYLKYASNNHHHPNLALLTVHRLLFVATRYTIS